MHDRSISCAFQPQVDMLGIHSRSRLCDMLVSILCMFRDWLHSIISTIECITHAMSLWHAPVIRVLISDPPGFMPLRLALLFFKKFRGVFRALHFAVVHASRVLSSASPLPFLTILCLRLRHSYRPYTMVFGRVFALFSVCKQNLFLFF